MKLGEITALHIVALQIDANSKAGTPEWTEAVKMLEDAKQMWREKFTKRCPHCGSRPNPSSVPSRLGAVPPLVRSRQDEKMPTAETGR